MSVLHVAVTGASTGIGEAIVRAFAARGHKLTLISRRREQLDAIAASLSGPSFVHAADLSRPERCEDWITPAERALGPVQVLVNNAGVQNIEPTAEMDVESGEALLRLNVFTPLRLIRAVLPGMITRGSGALVNIASVAALAPTAGMTYYNASKGGLAAASEALQGELRGTGVSVVTVYPGIISTDMGEKGMKKYETSLALRAQPVGRADVLAGLIADAVERGSSRVIYPRFNLLTRHFPGPTRWFMDRMTPALKRG